MGGAEDHEREQGSIKCGTPAGDVHDNVTGDYLQMICAWQNKHQVQRCAYAAHVQATCMAGAGLLAGWLLLKATCAQDLKIAGVQKYGVICTKPEHVHSLCANIYGCTSTWVRAATAIVSPQHANGMRLPRQGLIQLIQLKQGGQFTQGAIPAPTLRTRLDVDTLSSACRAAPEAKASPRVKHSPFRESCSSPPATALPC